MNSNFPHHQAYIDATNAASDKLWHANRNLQHLTDQYYNMMHQYHPEE